MADDDVIRIKTGTAVSYIADSSREYVVDGPTRAEWDAMTEAERDEYLEDVAQVTLSNAVEAWAYVADTDA